MTNDDLERRRAEVDAFEDEQIAVAGRRLAQEARERQREAERAHAELQEQVSEAVDVAREALGRDASPEAVATLAAAILQRRFILRT